VSKSDATTPPAFRPILKWPGGKTREWRRLGPLLPRDVRHLADPFMGGLAPFALTEFSGEAHLNDLHPLLVDLHRRVQSRDAELHAALERLASDWEHLAPLAEEFAPAFVRLVQIARDGAEVDSSADVESALRTVGSPRGADADRFRVHLTASVADKARRLARLEVRHDTHFDEDGCRPHGETAVRAAYYTVIRERERTATGAERAADFLFVRDFCYGSMFRTNAAGEFNIPYGGATYNGKSFRRRTEQLRSEEIVSGLARATFSNEDFELFLDRLAPALDRRDLVFLDPPYDSDFSTYGTNVFSLDDHERLAAAMARSPARWLLVIKETPDVRRIYVDGVPRDAGGRVALRFGKQYGYNVRGRNVRDTRHVVVTNY
jgi:DNA adenine methylase